MVVFLRAMIQTNFSHKLTATPFKLCIPPRNAHLPTQRLFSSEQKHSEYKVRILEFGFCKQNTPWKINVEPETTPLEEENHHISGFYFNLPGCSRELADHHNVQYEYILKCTLHICLACGNIHIQILYCFVVSNHSTSN